VCFSVVCRAEADKILEPVTGMSFERFGDPAGIFTMRNNKVIRVRWYSHRAEALDAVGLSEQDAHADS
jgi:hypothetical protein